MNENDLCGSLCCLHTNTFTVRSSFTLRPLLDRNVMVKTDKLHSMMGKTETFGNQSENETLEKTRKYFVTTKNCGKSVRVEEVGGRIFLKIYGISCVYIELVAVFVVRSC